MLVPGGPQAWKMLCVSCKLQQIASGVPAASHDTYAQGLRYTYALSQVLSILLNAWTYEPLASIGMYTVTLYVSPICSLKVAQDKTTRATVASCQHTYLASALGAGRTDVRHLKAFAGPRRGRTERQASPVEPWQTSPVGPKRYPISGDRACGTSGAVCRRSSNSLSLSKYSTA